ncbi:MAG: hypothetical protein NTZ11_13410 [Gammaproteobacteria bacterium]|nr:hypothetical protein [Gammaproteobacteria bacterium]
MAAAASRDGRAGSFGSGIAANVLRSASVSAAPPALSLSACGRGGSVAGGFCGAGAAGRGIGFGAVADAVGTGVVAVGAAAEATVDGPSCVASALISSFSPGGALVSAVAPGSVRFFSHGSVSIDGGASAGGGTAAAAAGGRTVAAAATGAELRGAAVGLPLSGAGDLLGVFDTPRALAAAAPGGVAGLAGLPLVAAGLVVGFAVGTGDDAAGPLAFVAISAGGDAGREGADWQAAAATATSSIDTGSRRLRTGIRGMAAD